MTDDQFLQLAQGQARIEATVADMKTRLFGNGQPGALHYLNTQHDDYAKATDDRLGKLERKQAWFTGAGSVLGAVVGYLSSYLHKG